MTELKPLGNNPLRQVQTEMAELQHSGSDPIRAQEHIAQRMAELSAILKGKSDATQA